MYYATDASGERLYQDESISTLIDKVDRFTKKMFCHLEIEIQGDMDEEPSKIYPEKTSR